MAVRATVVRPLTLAQIDPAKLSLVSESAARAMVAATSGGGGGESAAPRVKRIRTSKKTSGAASSAATDAATTTHEPMVWMYDGDVAPWIQLGRGRDIDDPAAATNLYMCWQGVRRFQNPPKKYFTVESETDVGWVAAELASRTGAAAKGKPTGQLSVELTVPLDCDKANEGDNDAARLLAFMTHLNDKVWDAMCNGVPHVDADGRATTMCWWPKGDPKRGMTREFAVRCFKGPFSDGGGGVGKNGTPYSPQVRMRVRWFLEGDKDDAGSANAAGTSTAPHLSLKPPIVDLATGKPITCDPFALFRRSRGKYVVSLGDVRYKQDNEVNMSLGLERCALGQRDYRPPVVAFADDDDDGVDESACAAVIDKVSAGVYGGGNADGDPNDLPPIS